MTSTTPPAHGSTDEAACGCTEDGAWAVPARHPQDGRWHRSSHRPGRCLLASGNRGHQGHRAGHHHSRWRHGRDVRRRPAGDPDYAPAAPTLRSRPPARKVDSMPGLHPPRPPVPLWMPAVRRRQAVGHLGLRSHRGDGTPRAGSARILRAYRLGQPHDVAAASRPARPRQCRLATPDPRHCGARTSWPRAAGTYPGCRLVHRFRCGSRCHQRTCERPETSVPMRSALAAAARGSRRPPPRATYQLLGHSAEGCRGGRSDVGLRVASVPHGGWDHHENPVRRTAPAARSPGAGPLASLAAFAPTWVRTSTG
jgi:hypothetical protein